jgi:hypothetical protein
MRLINLYISSIIFSCIVLNCIKVNSQGRESSRWFFLTHTQKISRKFDVLADFQLRTSSEIKYVNTLLIRSAFQYNINDAHAFALGYASKSDWTRKDHEVSFDHENRIYQQYQLNVKIKQAELNARVRLEQRFIKESGEMTKFSQRARLFISSMIPLMTDPDFSKGLYANIQNEIFFNVYHKINVNNRTFDQNRSQIAFGYRWNKKIDTDLGYQFWYQKEKNGSTRTNIIVFNISTNF